MYKASTWLYPGQTVTCLHSQGTGSSPLRPSHKLVPLCLSWLCLKPTVTCAHWSPLARGHTCDLVDSLSHKPVSQGRRFPKLLLQALSLKGCLATCSKLRAAHLLSVPRGQASLSVCPRGAHGGPSVQSAPPLQQGVLTMSPESAQTGLAFCYVFWHLSLTLLASTLLSLFIQVQHVNR